MEKQKSVTKFLEIIAGIFRYKNVSETANKISARLCLCIDQLKHNIVNKTTSKIFLANPGTLCAY